MSTSVELAIVAISIVVVMLLIRYLLVPYIQLQIKRRQSWEHIPQPEEIWVQDNGILYIDGVSASGVELLTITVRKDGTQYFDRWKDSWDDWQKRLHMRTVFFTGQKRPLGGA